MKNEPISRAMTIAPVAVGPSDSVAAAERIMRQQGCHHVPVVDNAGRVIGMISPRDLLKALVLEPDAAADSKSGSLQARAVADVMQRNVLVLPQTSTLLDAARALANGDIHAVPVVAPGGVLSGIITSSDLVDRVADGIEHPPANDHIAASDGELASDEQARLFRQVYRAAVCYLESGGDEIEHTRLVQAVTEAHERIADADLPI
jgi:CBS domain-containing protein